MIKGYRVLYAPYPPRTPPPASAPPRARVSAVIGTSSAVTGLAAATNYSVQVLAYTVLYCAVLYCTVLYCIILYYVYCKKSSAKNAHYVNLFTLIFLSLSTFHDKSLMFLNVEHTSHPWGTEEWNTPF